MPLNVPQECVTIHKSGSKYQKYIRGHRRRAEDVIMKWSGLDPETSAHQLQARPFKGCQEPFHIQTLHDL